MKISDLLGTCLRNLTRRKLRTILTVIGVVVGTCFIVLPISLGIAISVNNQKMLEQWGDLTLIEVNNYGNTETPLDDTAIGSIRAIPGVEVVTPIMQMQIQGEVKMFAGRKNRYQWYAWNVVGMSAEALDKLGYTTSKGRMLTPDDVGSKKIRVMFGDRTAYDFEDTKKRWPNNMVDYWSVGEGEELPDPFFDPLETELTYQLSPARENGKPVTFQLEVVGIFKGDYRRGYETVYGAVMDIEDLKRIQQEYEKANNIKKDKTANKGYETAKVKCVSMDHVAEVEEAIHALGFVNTYSMEKERQNMQENARQIQLILGFIGGVVMIASAVSIMNTMYTAVIERTKEIGIMKVLGCELFHIRAIFLIEAGLIGFIGGVVGDAISFVGSYILNLVGSTMQGGGAMMEGYTTQMSIIPPWLAATGILFATLVGLVSGVYPAHRAVQVSALEAIRTE